MRFFVILAVLLFYGCSGYKTGINPPEVNSFSNDGNSEIDTFFWENFNDSMLNNLINEALINNFNLKAAFERIKAASFGVDIKEADLYPNLNYNQRFQNQHTLKGKTVQGDTFISSLNLSYTLDFFGQIEALVNEAKLKALINIENYKEASMSLALEIVNSYLTLGMLEKKEELLELQIESTKKVLEVLKYRFSISKSDASDILRQEREIEALNFELLTTREQKESLLKKLSFLSSKDPTKSMQIKAKLPEEPFLPKFGLPSSLIENRPDLRAAKLLILARDEKAKDAYFRQYPKITLGFDATSSAQVISNLYQHWLSSFLASLTQPIFNAGSLKANAKLAKSEAQEAAYLFYDSYLKAVFEIEDALNSFIYKSKELNSIKAQITLAKEAYNRLLEKYYKGVSSFLDVLNAQINYQRLERDELNLYYQKLLTLAKLYKALGMGANKLKVEAYEN